MASPPANTPAVSTKQRKAATTGEEDTAPSDTIMQAFSKAGKKDAKSTEARQKAVGDDEGRTEGDAEESIDKGLRATQPPHRLFLHLQTEVLHLYDP